MTVARNVLLFCLFLSFSANAEKANDTRAADALNSRFKAMQTLQGRFEQTLFDGKGESLQTSRGSFAVKRPGYFLWDVDAPFEQKVLGTPERLKVYDPDLAQLTVYKKNSLAGTPALLMSGDSTAIAGDYQVSLEEKGTRFVLIPSSPESSQFIRLRFDFSGSADGAMLVAMSFTDKLDQRTEIVLTDLKMNQSLAASYFEFTPPEDTDIIIDG